MKNIQLQKIIGERIREIRESKGITQQDLAAACNIEKSNISRIEAGRTNFTISTLYKISVALEVKLIDLVDTVNWVVFWKGKPTTPNLNPLRSSSAVG